MITEYFGFKQNPFGLVDNVTFFYMDSAREKICQRILSNIQDGVSPIVLTGALGVGKTELLRHLFTLLPKEVHGFTSTSSCLDYTDRVMMTIDLLPENLRRNKKLLLLVDNAQDVTDADLSKLLSLSERYSDKTPSFQMIWCGSESLDARLSGIHATKFKAQSHYHLLALNQGQVKQYIGFCLERAGHSITTGGEIFSSAAIEKIAQLSQGLPHAINLLCGASLMVTRLDRQKQVSGQIVEEASRLCLLPLEKTKDGKSKLRVKPASGMGEILSSKANFHNLYKRAKRSVRYYWYKTQWEQFVSNPTELSMKQSFMQSVTLLRPVKQSKLYSGGLMVLGLCLLSLAGFVGLMGFQYFEQPVDAPIDSANVSEFIEALPKTGAGIESGKSSTQALVVDRDPKVKVDVKTQTTHAKFLPKTVQETSDVVKEQPISVAKVKIPEPTKPKAKLELAKIESSKEIHKVVKLPESKKIAPPKLVDVAESVPNLAHHLKQPPPIVNSQQSAVRDTESSKVSHNDKLVKLLASEKRAQPQRVEDVAAPKMAAIKQTAPVIDSEEAATRERTRSRLNLDKLGVEFNTDALMVAAQKGDLVTLKLLIAAGIPPDIKNSSGQTALMTAVRGGHKQVVKALLDLKARPNVTDNHGWTAIKYADQHQQSDISHLLVSAGAQPQD